MARKTIVVVVLGLTLASVHLVESQQTKKVPRIGYLSSLSPSSESNRSKAIRLALRELGYIEGQNIVIESRYGEGKQDRAPELAGELVRLKVAVFCLTRATTTKYEITRARPTPSVPTPLAI
jgi:putative tryptophan/tyrosine transport system substrate-binding protein